jgi:hypothetical protein
MAFTLWLSAEEEQTLERIMRLEGTRTKEQAVIRAIMDKGAELARPHGLSAPADIRETVPAARGTARQFSNN